MKKNRFWRYWSIYLIAVIFSNFVLMVLFPHTVKIDLLTIVPVTVFCYLLFRGRRYRLQYEEHFVDYSIYTIEERAHQAPFQYEQILFERRVEGVIYLYTAPLMIPAGLFGSLAVKVFVSGAAMLLINTLPAAVIVIRAFVERKHYREDQKKELDEQIEREEQEHKEELGKWK